MDKEIVSQLNKLKNIKPDKNWKSVNREILMSQISGSTQTEKQPHDFIILIKETLLQEISLITKPVAALALILFFMLGGGFFSISAASEATPGSFLYTVKLVSEKTQFALTPGQEKKLILGIKFVERRAKEIESLANSNEHTKIEKVANNLRQEIVAIQDRLARIEAEDPATALELAKDIDSKSNELRLSLKNTKNNLSKSTTLTNNQLNEAIRSVEATGLNALNTIIKEIGSTDKTAERDLSDRVAIKLQTAREQIAEVKDDASKVFSAGLGKSEQGVEVYQTPQKEIDQKAQEAEKIIEEAEELLNNNNYKEALEKINESQELIAKATEVTKKIQEEVGENSSSTPEFIEATEEGEVKGVVEIINKEQQNSQGTSTETQN